MSAKDLRKQQHAAQEMERSAFAERITNTLREVPADGKYTFNFPEFVSANDPAVKKAIDKARKNKWVVTFDNDGYDLTFTVPQKKSGGKK